MAKLRWGGGGITLDEGAYDATFVGHEICDPTPRSPNQNQWQRWTFLVNDGTPDGVELVAATSISTGIQSNAYKWLSAILGAAPPGEADPGDYCPRSCKVIIKRDPATNFLKVVDVLTVKGPPPQAPRPARPVPPPDPDDDIPF